jgi:homoserine kinase
MKTRRQQSFKVRVPASTANLGCGFDCLALALDLHLTVRATVLANSAEKSSAHITGIEGSSELPTAPENNLMLRAMRHTADREKFSLPTLRLDAQNEIPLGGGLGSSAAAVVAGVVLAYKVANKKVTQNMLLQRAAEIEGHADNAAAALFGGLVVAMSRDDKTFDAIHLKWPRKIRAVVVTPHRSLDTKSSRAALPNLIALKDAVHNLQRSAVFVAALASRRYELLWDAMRDRLHQPYRYSLVPGLEEILTMEKPSGVLGIALSGAGPSVLVLATEKSKEAGDLVAGQFKKSGLASTVRILKAAQKGLQIFD